MFFKNVSSRCGVKPLDLIPYGRGPPAYGRKFFSPEVDKATKNVAINIDALPPVTPEEGLAAAERTAELVRRFCGAEVEIFKLSEENYSVEV